MSAIKTDTLDHLMGAPVAGQPATSPERESQHDGKPQILLPGDNRTVSEFAAELGQVLAPSQAWFVNNGRVVTIEGRPVNGHSRPHAFREISASEARTRIESHVAPCTLRVRNDGPAEAVRVTKTVSKETMQAVLDCQQFKQQLPPVERILELSLPILHEGQIVQVRQGYDERFRTYCFAQPEEPPQLTLDAAKAVIEEVHQDFCFADATARTMAIARLLTPYCRGLMGFAARPPVWMFEGNRARAGKDCLAGCTLQLFEGEAKEEPPLKDNGEETTKRILAAAQSGRRFMHFANCKGHLNDSGLEHATTARTLGGRLLGRNDAAASLCVPNELDFSLSGNTGLTYTEDLSLRVRKITLSFMEEDANARQFRRPAPHAWIRENRVRIFAAMAAFVRHWDEQGRPAGAPFSSFPEWSRVVGGIMVCCGLGDPCVSQVQEGLTGDESTENMRLLLRAIHTEHGEHWISKTKLLALVERLATGDAFVWFDPLARSHQTMFGKELARFDGRELGGLRLERDLRDRSRPRFRVLATRNPASDGSGLRTCGPCEPPAPSSTAASGRQNHHHRLVCEPCEPCEPLPQFTGGLSGGKMMSLPVDDGENPPLNGGEQVRDVRNVRMEQSTQAARERLSRLNPVKEPSQAFSA